MVAVLDCAPAWWGRLGAAREVKGSDYVWGCGCLAYLYQGLEPDLHSHIGV
jgi:hypothetical protein